jgi:hypothetical protein
VPSPQGQTGGIGPQGRGGAERGRRRSREHRSVSRSPLPRPFSDGPFDVADAIRSGVGPGRLRGSDLVTPHRGVRAPTDLVAAADAIGLARLLVTVMEPSWVFSHVTALALWGLPLPTGLERRAALHVSTDRGRGPRRGGVVAHRNSTSSPALVLHGLRVVDPLTAWIQSAALLGIDDLVAVGDALCAEWSPHEEARRFSRDALAERVAGASGARGVACVRAALDLVRPGVESPKETELRLLLQRAGLPEFELNVKTFDEAGRYLGKPDLRDLDRLLSIEYEGDEHRTDPQRFRQDIARRERFADAGWRTIRVTEADLHGRAARELIARVERCLKVRSPAEWSGVVLGASVQDKG